jgi:hypothetical protein
MLMARKPAQMIDLRLAEMWKSFHPVQRSGAKTGAKRLDPVTAFDVQHEIKPIRQPSF